MSEYLTDSNQAISKNKVCCFNCKWFEQRTCFCRKNPPIPIQTYIKGIGSIPNSAFPKINIPDLDWCSFFENNVQLNG